jgi:hypothetical protein
MIDFLSKRLELNQKSEDSNADEEFKDGDYQWEFLKDDCYQNRDSDSKHIKDKEEFGKDVALGEATEDNLDTGPMFIKSSAWGLLFVEWDNSDSQLSLLFDEEVDGAHHCEDA